MSAIGGRASPLGYSINLNLMTAYKIDEIEITWNKTRQKQKLTQFVHDGRIRIHIASHYWN